MREMKDSGVKWIGIIPKEWDVILNKYILCGMYSGGTPSSGDSTYYVENGMPFVTISDMSKVDYINSTKNCLSQAGISSKNLKRLDKGTILYSIYATIGEVSELSIPAYINQAILALIPDETVIDKQYYKYNLIAMKDYIIQDTNGNTQINLNAYKVRNFHFVLPPLSHQKTIVGFLNKECDLINFAIAKQEECIEKLKEYKLSIITETVTKGINPNTEMTESGIEWIGQIPANWSVYRVANLYDQTNEKGSEELPILTVSINSGISDRELDDDEQDRVFARSEDRTKYKRVIPGDLAYNMMRAWQGAFGAVRVDGMVSPAYITCRPKAGVDIDTRYIEYLFRSPMAIEEMHRHSHGVADFRLRLYWPEFKNIKLCLPPIDEQSKIADHIDKVSAAIDDEINRIQLTVNKLNDYKKSLIFEVVTGKKEIVSL